MRDGMPAAGGVHACSACDGDYEDPERTAWSDDEDEDAGESRSDHAEQDVARERFPVREE